MKRFGLDVFCYWELQQVGEFGKDAFVDVLSPAAFIETPVVAWLQESIFCYGCCNGFPTIDLSSFMVTEFGDYTLSPAYDLTSTVLHTPQEEDTALALFEGDTETTYYQRYGCYGRVHFEELAERLGVVPRRAQGIMEAMLGSGDAVVAMVEESFLSTEAKDRYLHAYRDKVRRFANQV